MSLPTRPADAGDETRGGAPTAGPGDVGSGLTGGIAGAAASASCERPWEGRSIRRGGGTQGTLAVLERLLLVAKKYPTRCFCRSYSKRRQKQRVGYRKEAAREILTWGFAMIAYQTQGFWHTKPGIFAGFGMDGLRFGCAPRFDCVRLDSRERPSMRRCPQGRSRGPIRWR